MKSKGDTKNMKKILIVEETTKQAKAFIKLDKKNMPNEMTEQEIINGLLHNAVDDELLEENTTYLYYEVDTIDNEQKLIEL
jgi:hypothetical protein